MKPNQRRRPTAAERLEHVQTLELLATMIVQMPMLPHISKQFVVFSYDPPRQAADAVGLSVSDLQA